MSGFFPWIVVGDIHLHEGSSPLVATDLAQLVRQATEECPEAWIIFNGDTFDLDRVAKEPCGGMGHGRAAARLERLLASLPILIDALRQHVVRGGRIFFLAGNHDAELLLPDVREVLVRVIGDEENVRVMQRLCEADRVVEHGHQADPDAAFHPDPATAVAKQRLSALPLGSLMTRVLLSRIPRFELAGDNHRTPLEVLMRVIRDYKLGAVRMIAQFPIAGIRIVWHGALARVFDDVPRDSEMTMASPWRVARRLYLDRYFGVALGLPLVFALVMGWVPGWMGWPLGIVGVGLAIPPRRRKQFAFRDVRRCEGLAVEHGKGGVRLVVFGHTHRGLVTRMSEDGVVHANHGAFSSLVGEGRSYLRIEPDGSCFLRWLSGG